MPESEKTLSPQPKVGEEGEKSKLFFDELTGQQLTEKEVEEMKAKKREKGIEEWREQK